MAARATPASSLELYPIPSDVELTRFIMRRQRRDRDGNGRMIIEAPLTAVERRAVESRQQLIAAPLAPASKREITAALREMFTGFFAGEDEAGAAAVLAQYVTTLQGLPLFAIRRACLRFARGGVKAEEVREKTISFRGRPNTAHLRIVAEAIARPHWDEASCASLLLNAQVEKPVPEKTPASLAQAKEIGDRTRRILDQQNEVERVERQWNELIVRAERDNRDRDYHIGRWRALGLEPRFHDPSTRLTVASVDMYLHMGWRIEDGPQGTKMLVEPRRELA